MEPKTSLSTLQLIYQLYTGKISPNPLWHKPSYRLKFLTRSLFLHPTSLWWLKHLAQYPHLFDFLSRQTNLPCKLHRPYLSSQFSTKQNYKNLCFHYDFLSTTLTSHQCQYFFKNEGNVIADWVGKNDDNFHVIWVSEDRYGREGEFSLYFKDPDNITLAVLSFTLILYNNVPTLFIGGLQGSEAVDGHARISQATKGCFGLFPKRVLMECISIIAKQWNCQQIAAVGNKSHVYNKWRYRKRFKTIFSDYDSFWESIGGTHDGRHFILPPSIPRKPIEEIASKKRSEYRRRYGCLDTIEAQVKEKITLDK